MKFLKYFIEFIIIILFFGLFKILGFRFASNLGGQIGKFFGPFFRSKKRLSSNIKKALPDLDEENIQLIIKKMWANYGRILSEYMFIKNFRNSKLEKFFAVEGQEILDEIKNSKEQVIFVSGHFNNFELMALQLEKSGIDLAAIYRPLNNIFLNVIMEKIRKKHICKNQIKKGRSGTRELLEFFNKKYSIALMIDQRVSEGIKSNFFGHLASTTTIPAQIIKKFKCRVVPIYIERIDDIHFKMTVNKPISYSEDSTIENITESLNKLLEKMILLNPSQWIWTHDRWK